MKFTSRTRTGSPCSFGTVGLKTASPIGRRCSVGEQQRGGCPALANRPKLILRRADGQRRSGHQQQIVDDPRTCREEQVSLILVTHAEVAKQFGGSTVWKASIVCQRSGGMSLWKIAWRSIQQRGLASFLTAFSMGWAWLVVGVLVIHAVVDQSFRRGLKGMT